MLSPLAQNVLKKVQSLPGAYPSSRLPAVVFVHESYSGVIRIYGTDMMELEIIDGLSHENIFWLHIQIVDEEMVHPFLEAFFMVLYQPELVKEKQAALSNRPCKAAIVCSSGLSSQLYASLLEEASFEQGQNEYIFASFGLEELNEAFDFGDYVFLAPQIAYLKASIEKQYARKVYDIPAKEYGLLHISSVIDVLNERNET